MARAISLPLDDGAVRPASVFGLRDAVWQVAETAEELVRTCGRDQAVERSRRLAGACPDLWNFWYRVYLRVVGVEG